MKLQKAPPVPKTTTYQPGPMAPPPPEPEPYKVPRMSNLAPQPAPLVWRVTEMELDDLISWLVPALKDKWPRLNEHGIWSWLRAATGDNATLFVRTKNVAGMFHSFSSNVLEPWPIVREKFVRERMTAKEEAALLYQHAKQWAVGIKAREMIIGEDSDSVYQTHIVPALQTFDSPVKKKMLYVVSLRE